MMRAHWRNALELAASEQKEIEAHLEESRAGLPKTSVDLLNRLVDRLREAQGEEPPTQLVRFVGPDAMDRACMYVAARGEPEDVEIEYTHGRVETWTIMPSGDAVRLIPNGSRT